MFQLRVDGMTCDHCVRAVTEAVQTVSPEAKVAVDLGRGLVTIAGAEAGLSPAAYRTAIEAEGYTVQ